MQTPNSFLSLALSNGLDNRIKIIGRDSMSYLVPLVVSGKLPTSRKHEVQKELAHLWYTGITTGLEYTYDAKGNIILEGTPLNTTSHKFYTGLSEVMTSQIMGVYEHNGSNKFTRRLVKDLLDGASVHLIKSHGSKGLLIG